MDVPNNDIEIYRGADVIQPFVMTTPPVGGIAGWNLVLTVKKSFGAADVLLTKAATITDPIAAAFQFIFLSADTIALTGTSLKEVKEFVYDVQRTDSGSLGPWSIGKFRVLPEVRL